MTDVMQKEWKKWCDFQGGEGKPVPMTGPYSEVWAAAWAACAKHHAIAKLRPLSDQKIKEILEALPWPDNTDIHVARAVEHAHGIK
jgi:hypothetical protein